MSFGKELCINSQLCLYTYFFLTVSYQSYAQEELVQYGPEDAKRPERELPSQQQQKPKLTHPPFPDLDPRHVESSPHPQSQNSLSSSSSVSKPEDETQYPDEYSGDWENCSTARP